MILNPFAPHLSEELWQKLGKNDSLSYTEWPSFDESALVEDEVEILVQIKGKPVARMMASPLATPDELIVLAKALPEVAIAIDGKRLVKEIAVPGRLVNLVAV